MDIRILFLSAIVVLVTVFCSPGYAQTAEILKGSIEKEQDNYDVIFFVPEETLLTMDDINSRDTLSLADMERLDLNRPEKLTAQQQRYKNIASFLIIGGTAVGRSIEKSIASDQVHRKMFSNIKNPVGALREGWGHDDNEFLINYVGHPFEFMLLSSYLKASGASDKEAFLLSQLTNFTWEYVVEGSYVRVSPKDLLTDTAGALLGICLYKTALRKPIDKIYQKLSDVQERYGIEMGPQLNYNPDTRGVVIGVNFTISH